MTISNSKIEMGIAKSQADKIYKYLARGKTFTSSSGRIQHKSLVFYKHSFDFGQDYLCACILCSSKDGFHQFRTLLSISLGFV